VLGSIEFTLNGHYTNNSIVVSNQKIAYVPKTQILRGEANQGLESGLNQGPIPLSDYHLAVLICADLWNLDLIQRVANQTQVIACPAWTATTVGQRAYAKFLWESLVWTRSHECGIPIIVSDHFFNTETRDVANATFINDPQKTAQFSFTDTYKITGEIQLNSLRKSLLDSFCLVTDKQSLQTPRSTYDKNFHIAASSLAIKKGECIETFATRLKEEIEACPQTTRLLIFSAACWGSLPYENIFTTIENLKAIVPQKLAIVFGALDLLEDNKLSSFVLILYQNELIKKQANAFHNPATAILKLSKFKIALLNCQNLWMAKQVKNFVHKYRIDIVVTSNASNDDEKSLHVARMLFVRSKENGIPFAISQSSLLKEYRILHISDPAQRKLSINTESRLAQEINLKATKAARKNWKSNGLTRTLTQEVYST
jgi:predicted amidohydrolase